MKAPAGRPAVAVPKLVRPPPPYKRMERPRGDGSCMVKVRRRPLAAGPVDTREHARAAGLRYVLDTAPGITRRRAGTGWSYRGPDGRPVRDRATLERIRKLAIPPAYTDVWIAPAAEAHLQATGRDARGRKQYRYHERWREVRDDSKFGRMVAFSAALPRIRERVSRDLAAPGLGRAKVLAAAVRILDLTGMRVGNHEYARTNNSFGLTTLRDRHVSFPRTGARFSFRGKSGKAHDVDITDRRLARVIRQCRDIPGQDLFQYYDDDGTRQAIGSGDVNAYLREVSGEEFTAKDFRTWAGTALAAGWLDAVDLPEGDGERQAVLVRACDFVAGQLNNTRAICRKYYIHPAVFAAWQEGTLHGLLARGARRAVRGLRRPERAVLAVLREATP